VASITAIAQAQIDLFPAGHLKTHRLDDAKPHAFVDETDMRIDLAVTWVEPVRVHHEPGR